jgi:hypothetical protein
MVVCGIGRLVAERGTAMVGEKERKDRHKGRAVLTRLPDELFAVLQADADDQQRSVSQMLRLVLEAHYAAKGAYQPSRPMRL